MKKISIITPVFNESKNLEMYFLQMFEVVKTLEHKYEFEFVFTDNRSTDDTFLKLKILAEKDSRIKVYRLSKNFGYQKSILMGFSKCTGDAAIEFDADLQDPPALLPEFINEWENGNKIVYGVRVQRQEGKANQLFRKIFYRIISRISDNDLPVDTGDFVLVDRVIIDLMKTYRDSNPYLRGFIFSLGYSRKGIPYSRRARNEGESKFSFIKNWELALDGIIAQSVLPLKLASYFGIFIAIGVSLLSLFYIYLKIFTNVLMPPGFTTITLIILLSVSMNAIFLGIIGEYLARIYLLQRNNHTALIDESIN